MCTTTQQVTGLKRPWVGTVPSVTVLSFPLSFPTFAHSPLPNNSDSSRSHLCRLSWVESPAGPGLLLVSPGNLTSLVSPPHCPYKAPVTGQRGTGLGKRKLSWKGLSSDSWVGTPRSPKWASCLQTWVLVGSADPAAWVPS